MDEQLYLNKKLVEIGKNSITRKIQIGDIGDISTRNSSFSYSVKVKRTSNSAQVLDMLATNGNTSRKPFEFVVADYIVDGVPLIINGFAKIRSAGTDFIINLFDGVKDLSERLKGKKLEDLELGDLDHFLTSQGYIDSYSNTEGFIYCIADYGLGLPIGSLTKVEKQAPSIYIHTLFSKIFEQAGLNLVGDFFTTNATYLVEVLTPAKGYEILDSESVSTAKGGADTDSLIGFVKSFSPISVTEKFTFSDNGLVGASIVGGDIKFSVPGVYKIEIEASSDSIETFLYLDFKLNDVTKATISLETGFGKVKNTSIIITVAVDDVVSLYLIANSFYGEPGEQVIVDYDVSCDTLLFLQTGGQLIQASDYIGELNQIDLIKDVITRYGLILHPIRDSSDYNFKQLEVILNDRDGAEDWTDKVSLITNEDYVSGYAQSNKAVYQYPDEIVIPNNDGELIVDNDNAEAEKTIISSVFEIPNVSGLFAGETAYSIPIWVDDDGDTKLLETPLKVMHINRVNTTINARLFDEIVGVTQIGDIPFLNLDFLSMDYFLQNFYISFNSLLNNYRKFTAFLNLSLIDISNLNFFKLKYLKQKGRYYYLNNVQHNPKKLSKATIIEIKEFE